MTKKGISPLSGTLPLPAGESPYMVTPQGDLMCVSTLHPYRQILVSLIHHLKPEQKHLYLLFVHGFIYF